MYFYMKNILYVGYRITYKVINLTFAVTKAFLKGWKSGVIVNFLAPGSGSAFPILTWI
jgi:hypothetical protein